MPEFSPSHSTFAPIYTKLSPPQHTRAPMQRQRLRLLANFSLQDHKMATVVAPAGYGKSTLLAQWQQELSEQGIASAWLSLDAEDNDPARFLEYLSAALAKAFANSSVLSQPHEVHFATDPSAWLSRLFSDATFLTKPFFIFLDDFHVIHEAAVLEIVDRLIRMTAIDLHLILASRFSIPLQLSRLKLEGQLQEYHAKHLSFNPGETASFIRSFKGFQLDDPQIKILAEKSEGWIAALQLISLLLKETQDPQKILKNFSGKDRDLTQYLAEIVLDRQTPEMREFLLKISVLDRMCAELCQALTDRKDSQALLQKIEAANLFLIPLDRERQWFRFHHLFAEFLRQFLHAEYFEKISDLHLQASRWFNEKGLQSEAVQYALRGKHFEYAADLLENGCVVELVHLHGEHYTLIHWLEILPKQYIENCPFTRLAYVNSLSFALRNDQSYQELQALDLYIDREEVKNKLGPDLHIFFKCSFQAMGLMIDLFTERLDCVLEKGKRYIQAWPEAIMKKNGDIQKCGLYNLVAAAAAVSHEFDLGEALGRDAVVMAKGLRSDYSIAITGSVLGLVRANQGHLKLAMEIYREVKALTAGKLFFNVHAEAILPVQMAEVFYEWGDLQQARQLLEPMQPYFGVFGRVDPSLCAYRTWAKLHFYQNDPQAAFEILKVGETLGHERNCPRLSIMLAAERIRLLLKWGDFSQAQQLAQDMGFLKKEISTSSALLKIIFEELSDWTQVRLLIFEEKNAEAFSKISILLQQAKMQKRIRPAIQAMLLQASILEKQKDQGKADKILGEATQHAVTEDFIQIFVEEAKDLQVLKNILARPDSAHASSVLPWIHQLKAALNFEEPSKLSQDSPQQVFEKSLGLMESLTSREWEILKLLESESSNQELAKILFISEGTLKWHLNNIYSKLGVRNRMTAIAKIRQSSRIKF